MKRIFLGIPVSEEVRSKIISLQKELSSINAGIKLVEPANLHFTLKFFGEIEDQKISQIKEKISGIILGNSFSVKIVGLGCFPDEDRINVIWLGLKDGKHLKDMQQKVDASLSSLFHVEKDFVSHLTIARVKFVNDKQALKQFLEKYRNKDFGELVVDKIVLYQSVLGKDGPVYTELAEWGLER